MERRRMIGLAMLLAMPRGARADGSEEAARARAARQAGAVRPLADVLAGVEAGYAWKVIRTELEHEHGRWTYDLRLLTEAGQVYELRVDAATGTVIASRGQVERKPGPGG